MGQLKRSEIREQTRKPRLKTRLATALACAVLVFGPIGTCSYEASKYNDSVSKIPCKRLELPEGEGEEPLAENICMAVSGEQPKNIGFETKDLGEGRAAHTLFVEWDYDGITARVRKIAQDAEPITLITENDKPVEVHVRSHWRVGSYDFEECKQPSGKVVVTVSNAFHTPVVVGCTPTLVDPLQKGGINSFVFKVVSEYARAVGQWDLDTFKSLRKANVNEVPSPEHPARTQPLFAP